MTQPPSWIEAGACPGGVVIRIYEWPAGGVLVDRRLPPGSTPEAYALADVEAIAAIKTGRVVICAYDGDTGASISIGPIAEAWRGRT